MDSKIGKKTTKSFHIHEYLDCLEDSSNLTHLSQTTQNVDESLDKAAVEE